MQDPKLSNTPHDLLNEPQKRYTHNIALYYR